MSPTQKPAGAVVALRDRFDFRRLTVYRKAIDLLPEVDRATRALPTRWIHLGDEFRRALTSIVLNTAEGSGEFSSAEKRRFYRMARGSATEAAAIVEALLTLGLMDFETASELDKALDEITAMLTRLSMHTRALR